MAQIIDLNNNPIKNESYFIDTNVWFWATYVASKDMDLPNHPQEYQTREYPQFLEKALDYGSRLCHCPMTFSELANIIEKTELEIYRNQAGNQHLGKKQFRDIPEAREAVLSEIETAWAAINQMSECIDINLNKKFVENANSVMRTNKVDPFDAFYVQILKIKGIDYIVTDDSDFFDVAKLIVVTSRHHCS